MLCGLRAITFTVTGMNCSFYGSAGRWVGGDVESGRGFAPRLGDCITQFPNGPFVSAHVEWKPLSVDEVPQYVVGWLGCVVRLTVAVPSYHILNAGPESMYRTILSMTSRSLAFLCASSKSLEGHGSASVKRSLSGLRMSQ